IDAVKTTIATSYDKEYYVAQKLGIECSDYEEKIVMLQQKIGKQAGELDTYINKFRDLNRLIKELEESITSTRERTTRDMQETIELTSNTTARLIEKMEMIKNRIRDKGNILKLHQQLVVDDIAETNGNGKTISEIIG
ncbi:9948_t:CDS:2, partial [Ambispora leptoticha]